MRGKRIVKLTCADWANTIVLTIILFIAVDSSDNYLRLRSICMDMTLPNRGLSRQLMILLLAWWKGMARIIGTNGMELHVFYFLYM
jgi:hypothetical protein